MRLQLKVNNWWLAKAKSLCFKEIISFVPSCIVWELWKNRNKCRFEGIVTTTAGIITNIHKAIIDKFSGDSILSTVAIGEIPVLKNT